MKKPLDMSKESFFSSISLPQFDLRTVCNWKILSFLGIVLPLIANSQQISLPWLNNIDPKETIKEIHTISSQAEVTVSDGLTYKVNTVFHDNQRAIFQRVYKDRTVVQGVAGKYIWEFDGSVESEVSNFIGGLVLGHQFHAQILFFDKLHPSFEAPKNVKFKGKNCLVITSKNENQNFKFYFEETQYPLGFEIIRENEKNIIFEFNDWRTVADIRLPFQVLIDDGERKFNYSYQTISFNEGSILDFKAPESVLTEEQKLLNHHRIIMDGHYFGQTNEMKKQQSETMIMVSEGEIYHIPGNQPDAMIDRIMSNRDYTTYDDLVRPIVQISGDGQLGWVIAQVSAKGIRFDEDGNPKGPLEFVCTWIELYEKVDGQWRMKGNVSNFQPGLK